MRSLLILTMLLPALSAAQDVETPPDWAFDGSSRSDGVIRAVGRGQTLEHGLASALADLATMFETEVAWFRRKMATGAQGDFSQQAANRRFGKVVVAFHVRAVEDLAQEGGGSEQNLSSFFQVTLDGGDRGVLITATEDCRSSKAAGKLPAPDASSCSWAVTTGGKNAGIGDLLLELERAGVRIEVHRARNLTYVRASLTTRDSHVNPGPVIDRTSP